jgi:hypothetical protein
VTSFGVGRVRCGRLRPRLLLGPAFLGLAGDVGQRLRDPRRPPGLAPPARRSPPPTATAAVGAAAVGAAAVGAAAVGAAAVGAAAVGAAAVGAAVVEEVGGHGVWVHAGTPPGVLFGVGGAVRGDGLFRGATQPVLGAVRRLRRIRGDLRAVQGDRGQRAHPESGTQDQKPRRTGR